MEECTDNTGPGWLNVLVCIEIEVVCLLELGKPTELLDPSMTSDADVTILLGPSSVDISESAELLLLTSPALSPPPSPPVPEIETVFRLVVVVKVIEVTSTLPACCPPIDASEEAVEELEGAEGLENAEEAKVDNEPNTSPVDLVAVCVSVTVTRARVPLSALPADTTGSLETGSGMRAVR